MPSISIILPIYNAEKYIPKCLDGLLSQTFNDIEVICINDGSKDGSLQILNDYAKQDNRIRVITQDNSGPARARNTGLENAKGDYIMFCDSDDWFEPDMCEIMLKNIKDTDIVCCNANVIDEEENLNRIDDSSYYQNAYHDILKLSNNIICKTNFILWNKIFKKAIIDEYKISFPDGRENDDDCFILQYMSVANNINFIENKLYNYLRRADSIIGKISNKTSKAIFDKLYISKIYHDFLHKHNLFENKKHVFFYYLNQINNMGKHSWDEEHKNKAKEIFCSLYSDAKTFYPFVFTVRKQFLKIFFHEFILKVKDMQIYTKHIYGINNKRIINFLLPYKF